MTTTTKKTTTRKTAKAKEPVEVKEVEAVVKRPKNFRELRKILTRDNILPFEKPEKIKPTFLPWYYLGTFPGSFFHLHLAHGYDYSLHKILLPVSPPTTTSV